MNPRRIQHWLVGASLVLAGSAALAEDRDVPMTAGNDCAFFRSVYDWRALDERNLVIWAPSRRQPYQITLSVPVHALRFSESLAFVDRNGDGRLCGFGMDAVIVPDSIPERVTIAGMRRLDEHELAALLHRPAAPDRRPASDDNATGEQQG